MPPSRKRGSLRGGKVEEPVRTRYGRGAKSAKEEADHPSNHANGHLTTPKKATRSSSNLSGSSPGKPQGCHVEWHKPGYIYFHDVPRAFLEDLKFKDQQKKELDRELAIQETRRLRKERLHTGEFTKSDLENDTGSESESDVQTPPPVATRGRGRGGRGRGGRGRGRGRGRGNSGLTRDISPVRARKARVAAPVSFTEADDEESANQESAAEGAKTAPQSDEDEVMADANDDMEEEQEEKDQEKMDGGKSMTTPRGSPPPGSPPLEESKTENTKPPPPIPTIALPPESTTQTPQNGTSGAATPVLQMLDPEEDALSDSDFYEPWVEDYIPPSSEAECEDRADYLLRRRYIPMTDVNEIIAAITKFAPAQRSTESLYRLAENNQRILKAWQDEYLRLDARTAPHAHPPKKPANGGRVPIDPLVYEGMKEADLYSYVYDPKKLPAAQDPFAQRIGAEKSNGRALRQRRGRDALDSAAPSEVEDDGERGAGRRQRRATRRFEVGEPTTAPNTPPKKQHNGWGGARKRGISKYGHEASATPEPEGRAAKRAKTAANALLHHRIREMREQSAVTSSGEEGSTQDGTQEGSDAQPTAEEYRKRGRPAGSKNTGRRSDYGIKKGPRKKTLDAPAPAISQPGISSGPPPVLQSLSEGQNQFSIDPRPSTPSQLGVHGSLPASPMIAQPVSTVFQANPQPPGPPLPTALPPPPGEPNPDSYMSTTPLSQYNNPYDDASLSPASGSKQRKPRVKSEKRSQSMTQWWAERKARAKEVEEKTGVPQKPEGSKSSTPRPSDNRAPPPSRPQLQEPAYIRGEHMQREAYPTPPPPQHQHQHQHQHPHQHQHQHPHQHQPYAVQSPNMEYALPPPNQILMQNSPLTALPTGPGPLSTPFPSVNVPLGPRSSMPQLAPAPMPPQLPSYPSPYGPRQAPRPKSSGPPPLAPAPAHSHAHRHAHHGSQGHIVHAHAPAHVVHPPLAPPHGLMIHPSAHGPPHAHASHPPAHISPYPPPMPMGHGHGYAPGPPQGYGHPQGQVMQGQVVQQAGNGEVGYKVLVPGPPPPGHGGEGERRG